MERSRSNRDDRGSDRDDGRGSSSRGRDRESGRGGRDSGRGSERESSRGASGSGRGFSYQKRSAEDVNKRANQGGKDFDSYLSDAVKMYKVQDGANTIRIIPPTWEGAKHYGIDLWVHYGVGPDQQSYLCEHKMKGEACPICEELQRARTAQESEEYIKSLEPTKRVLFYLVDRDNEKDGVMAWAAPWTIDRDVTKISVDRKTGDVLPIDDPEEGYDVEFDRTGKGMSTKYVGLSISRRSSSLGDDSWLDFAVDHPLPEILVYHGYDHILKAFGGGGSSAGRDRGGDSDRGGRDRDSRDDRSSRDSERGGRDSDRGGRDRDDSDRGSDRSGRSDRGGRGERGGRSAPSNTWDSVHALQGEELDKLIDAERLKLDPNKFDSDEDLADAICEELDLKKEEDNSSRMSEMRSRRNRG